ncbi:MAG: PDR/VanB family oxidoreductase [Rhodoglobus sp.]
MAATHAVVWQTAAVVANEPLTPTIRRIVLTMSQPLKVAAGAHLDVRVRIAGELDRRSYSIVDASDDGETVAVSVLHSVATRGGAPAMHALAVGDEIEVTQPIVDFPLRIGAPSYVLLAGGIGITAILGMARRLRSVAADYRVVYVGRSRSELAYLKELVAEHGDRLELHIGDEGSSLSVPELVGSVGAKTELYMCGPIRLMDAVRRSWGDQGLSAPNLRFETFGNSGWHEAQEFTVRIPATGLETVVKPGETMLEALEAAGADMMYDCKKGECGLCEVRVRSLEGSIDHRDVFYSERQKDATSKMCCCVSRVVPTQAGGSALVEIEAS